MAKKLSTVDKYLPNGRSEHRSDIVGNNLYIWSGSQKDRPCIHSDETKRRYHSRVEILNLLTGNWKQCLTTGNPPLGFIGCSSAVVDSNIIFFGGYCGHKGCYHNSVTSLCVDTLNWKELSPTNPNAGPMMKCYCGMIPFKIDGKSYLLVIGGMGPTLNTPQQDTAQYTEKGMNRGLMRTNEHHTFDLSTGKWISPIVSGDCPPTCYYFSLTTFTDDKFVMFGGKTSDGRTNATYIGHCTKSAITWQKVNLSLRANWPKNRRDHATAVLDERNIIMIGGQLTIDCSDCWIFNIETKLWKKLTIPESVAKRYFHSVSSFNVTSDIVWVIVFGGDRSPDDKHISDTPVVELIRNDREWCVGEVMMHPLNDYEQKLTKRRKQSHQPSSQLKEIEQLRQELQKLQQYLQQERQEKQQLLLDKQQIEVEKQSIQQKNHQLHQEKLRLQQELHDSQEEERQILERERILLQQLQEIQHDKTSKELQNESSWIISREEIHMTEQILGRGGWGEVKVATFRGLSVAAKCLHELIISQYNISVFAREMSIAAKVRHPNLLQFIGATRVGSPIILCELMPTSLRKELETGPLTRPQIIKISQDVCSALNYLHLWKPHPILHRDVSSPNVLLEPSGSGQWKGKLSDYGSANLAQNISSTSVGPGNPFYSAPEAQFPDNHSPAMDVYSFGVLLVEMILCQLPSPTTAEREHQAESIRWISIKPLVKQCLNRQPTNRPSIAQVLSDFKLI